MQVLTNRASSMPPRLAHKKSRKGCVTKSVRPAAAVDGIRETASPKPVSSPGDADGVQKDVKRDESQPSSQQAVDDDAEDADTLTESSERRLLEMRLLHHFINHVIYTFPSMEDPTLRDTWYNDVVPMSFEHDFLRHTMLALSALHMMDKGPNDPKAFRSNHPGIIPCPEWNANLSKPHDTIPYQRLAKVYRVYLNLAFRQQREAVSRLSPENADAICFASSLISMVTYRLLPNPMEDNEPSTSNFHTLQWLHLLAALAGVVRVARPSK
ncbi:MAG: hypothetical protein Q9160_005755 [Pyrenula sp. 1 TL-2023]